LDAPKGIDLAAAARISSRVEFREIRLSEITASSPKKAIGLFEPKVEHRCAPTRREGDLLEILCSYQIRVTSEDDQDALLSANLDYLVSYTLLGDDPVDENDLNQFAFANGTYHSWPFVRQAIFDLTSRMGYPPYNLPVFKFFPKRPKVADTPAPPPPTENSEPEQETSASAEEVKTS
jgi:preprotein translocase subunit SecB